MMCTHWGAKLQWVKDTYGCIPCLHPSQRERAFANLPQSVRHLLGPNCLEPLEVFAKPPERPDRKLKAPHEYTREHEKAARRKAILQYVWAKPHHECGRIELCTVLDIKPQTLTTDFCALKREGYLVVQRVEGVAQIYKCIKPV
jgi:hypothetical protein